MAQRVNIEVLNKAAVDVQVQNSNAINVEVPTAPRGLGAPFTANKTEIDEGAVVDFTATNPGFEYLFSIEDVNGFINKLGKSVSHKFLDSGSFDVALTQADLNQQASGIQVKRDFIKVNQAPFLLNQPFGTGATAAYSLRKLKSSATKAVRVREDASNTETDIGFSGAILDETALLNHVGSNNGFVTKWYDQSGNNNDASNSNASEQPQIVSGGTVLQENGQPAIQFDGDDDILKIRNLKSLTIPTHIFLVAHTNKPNGGQDFLDGASGKRLLMDNNDSNNLRIFQGSSLSGGKVGSNQLLFSALFDGANSSISKNNSQVVSGDSGGDDGVTAINLGASTKEKKNLDGTEQELIIFKEDKSTKRTKIEDDINNFYSIF